jgi:alkylation response protein AidB-like acyl-CoA dehydrogenase
MTERKGGSDVANGTETIAIRNSSENSQYKLYGYKWFSSATDADITITLARCFNKETNKLDKGLTMFLANVRNKDGTLNGIEIHKLKDKLGTRQLPTAELLLDGMTAYKMSEEGRGISKMASMLNITRIHNSLASVSNMRRQFIYFQLF